MHRVQDESRRTPGLIVHFTVLRQYGHTEGAREPRAGNLNLDSKLELDCEARRERSGDSDMRTRRCLPGSK